MVPDAEEYPPQTMYYEEYATRQVSVPSGHIVLSFRKVSSCSVESHDIAIYERHTNYSTCFVHLIATARAGLSIVNIYTGIM